LIEVGTETVIGQQVSLSAGMLPGQDLRPFTVLSIGDRCVIGRGSHIVAHQSVTLMASRVVCTQCMSRRSGACAVQVDRHSSSRTPAGGR
jgi:hypothetical protein